MPVPVRLPRFCKNYFILLEKHVSLAKQHADTTAAYCYWTDLCKNVLGELYEEGDIWFEKEIEFRKQADARSKELRDMQKKVVAAEQAEKAASSAAEELRVENERLHEYYKDKLDESDAAYKALLEKVKGSDKPLSAVS